MCSGCHSNKQSQPVETVLVKVSHIWNLVKEEVGFSNPTLTGRRSVVK